MGRVLRGAVVRALYCLCIALITILVVVLYEGGFKASGSWGCSMGIGLLIVEGLITKKLTQGFDWKWFNPASIIFAGNCLAAIWFLQLRTLSFHSQGLEACTNTTAEQELTRIDLSLASDWLNFCACGHCNGAAEQMFVTVLLIGRYFLPRGVHFYHPEDDKINLFLKSIARTHFFLVITCNGADALDLLSYTRFPTVKGNAQLISMLLILFSVSIGQFCIDTLATAEQKVSDVHIIIETDLWSSLLIILTDDIPFLAMRLFIMTNYQVFSAMGVFFFFKNFVSICVTLHKGVMIWLGKDECEIEEYVASEPYSPEPPERLLSRMETPDSLGKISNDNDSIYSHEQAVRSRAAKRPPNLKSQAWGQEDTWFGESKSDLSQKPDAKENGGSQLIADKDRDVEAGTMNPDSATLSMKNKSDMWDPAAETAFFTDGYATECDSLLDASKIGNKKFVNVPLGPTLIRGRINYAHAAPKPEPRIMESAQSERREKQKPSKAAREKSSAEEDDVKSDHKIADVDVPDEWADENADKKKEKPKSAKTEKDEKIEEDIDDILNTVDEEEPKKEKKKKKKKDKDRDQPEESEPDRSEEKKKKKKSKSEVKDKEGEDDEERREKHKKKKKNKDKDKDRE